jgi:hypothetical protein
MARFQIARESGQISMGLVPGEIRMKIGFLEWNGKRKLSVDFTDFAKLRAG